MYSDRHGDIPASEDAWRQRTGDKIMQSNARMIRQAIIIASIVGPVLIAINQGPELVAGEQISYFKAVLTCIVPFLVSLASSLLSARERGGTSSTENTAIEDARGLLGEILINAQMVNDASAERRQTLETVVHSARQLKASLEERDDGDRTRSLDEIVEALSAMQRQVDTALEGSATNIRLARDGVGALEKEHGFGS